MSNRMWGGRFASGPAEIMEEINASIGFDKRLAPQDPPHIRLLMSSPRLASSRKARLALVAGGLAALLGLGAMEEINASIGFDKRLAPQDIRGSLAHVAMLGKAGILSTLMWMSSSSRRNSKVPASISDWTDLSPASIFATGCGAGASRAAPPRSWRRSTPPSASTSASPPRTSRWRR
jgi:hypothetical protein